MQRHIAKPKPNCSPIHCTHTHTNRWLQSYKFPQMSVLHFCAFISKLLWYAFPVNNNFQGQIKIFYFYYRKVHFYFFQSVQCLNNKEFKKKQNGHNYRLEARKLTTQVLCIWKLAHLLFPHFLNHHLFYKQLKCLEKPQTACGLMSV